MKKQNIGRRARRSFAPEFKASRFVERGEGGVDSGQLGATREAANVYASIFLMFMELCRRNLILGLPAYLAPVSLVTIHINMAIFATSVLTLTLDGFFHRFW